MDVIVTLSIHDSLHSEHHVIMLRDIRPNVIMLNIMVYYG